MGLFGKKEKIPDGIRVMYYEGELKEFPANHPCQILLMDNVLRITKINPYIEVKLDRKRILSIEVLSESDYMPKYKSSTGRIFKKGEVSVTYYVINYESKEGDTKHIDFWGTSQATGKVMKIRQELMKEQQPTTYEI